MEIRPGALRFATGSESVRYGSQTAIVQHAIEMRYWDQIRADWHAVDQRSGRVFQVLAYGDPDDRRRKLHVFCSEIQ